MESSQTSSEPQSMLEEDFKIEIVRTEEKLLEFDICGIDPAIANAFRRILLSEIPTLAIETVFITRNTSVIPDEVLAHRLGLIPIKADPNLFCFYEGKPVYVKTDFLDHENGEKNYNASNTLLFRLKVRCEPKRNSVSSELNNENDNINANEWVPQGNQVEISGLKDVSLVQPNILIAKLRPGQEIDLEMAAILGIGKDHAKFSPVATASYRLLPTIEILKPILNDDAEKFKNCFPAGVIKLKSSNDAIFAEVENARNDSVSRECLRYPEFKEKVRLGRRDKYFIFMIESVGSITPEALFLKSVQLLKSKSALIYQNLKKQRLKKSSD